jgi:hypothetical protein
MVSKANHDKRICGHDKHNVGISFYLCADVTSEEEKEKKKELHFLFLCLCPLEFVISFFYILSLSLSRSLIFNMNFKQSSFVFVRETIH